MISVLTKLVRGSLVLALSLWIAGAGCMFGCQDLTAFAATGNEAMGAEQGVLIVSGDACAANGSHDCCAKKKAEAKAKPKNTGNRLTLELATLISLCETLNSAPSSGGRECPLALSRAVAITKRSDNKLSSTPAVIAVTTPAVPITTEQHAALSQPSRLPNRGHTYLRCCVFLI